MSEEIKILDTCQTELELDAIIFRIEFIKRFQNYQENQSEENVIFCFIFLQIYLECFLHQNMRTIVALEFLGDREAITKTWNKRERRYVPEKLDNFLCLFSLSSSQSATNNTEIIKDGLQTITKIRNTLLHGHKIATWTNSRGEQGISDARLMLTPDNVDLVRDVVNNTGKAWNNLLDEVFGSCKALRKINDFKFQSV